MCSGNRLDIRSLSNLVICSCDMLLLLLVFSQVPLNPEVEDPEAFRKEEQERIDTAEPLTEEETAEKERLLQEVTSSPLYG